MRPLLLAFVLALGACSDSDAGLGSWCSEWSAGMAAVDAADEPFDSLLPTAEAGVTLGHPVISPAAADVRAAISTDTGDEDAPAPGAALLATYTIEDECALAD